MPCSSPITKGLLPYATVLAILLLVATFIIFTTPSYSYAIFFLGLLTIIWILLLILTFQIISCREKGYIDGHTLAEPLVVDDETLDQTIQTNGSTHEEATIEEESTAIAPTIPAPDVQVMRLYYLDNLKVFLTWLVVTHHVACAFGAAGTNAWPLTVGAYDNEFTHYMGKFIQLNQAYFMSLFFFISGYFAPSSYEKRRQDVSSQGLQSVHSTSRRYLMDKWKRLGRPATMFTFFAAPLIFYFCQWYMGKPYTYLPSSFQCWYLYWLLFFNLAYANVRKYQDEAQMLGTANEDRSTLLDDERKAIPGPLKRTFVYGAGICGGVMFLIMTMLGGYPTFLAGMPICQGSLANDILFFVAGIVAQKNEWLAQDLKSQLGMKVSYLYLSIALEIVTIAIITPEKSSYLVYFFQTIVAGMFCVDMSIALLQFFQEYMNFENEWSKRLSSAAYAVYIYHPIFIIASTSLFVTLYNHSIGKDNPVKWDEGHMSYFSSSPLTGGSETLVIGFTVSMILVHFLVWPTGYFFRL